MEVKVLSKREFEKDIVPILNTKEVEDYVLISILDPDNPDKFSEDKDNFKTFKFWDLEFELDGKITFTEEMAKELIEFILINKRKKYCVVHCSAGVSRSGAVGEFINDIMGRDDWSTFKDKNYRISPNLLVKKLLREAYFGK